MNQAKCEECGDLFPITQPTRRFCSQSCRVNKLKRGIYRDRNPLKPLQCPECGKHFKQSHGKQELCSRSCVQRKCRRKKNESLVGIKIGDIREDSE